MINPHPDAELVEMFRGVRQDARATPAPTEVAHNFVITLGFDGAAAVPTVGMCVILELGQIKARINGATICANGAGAATIDLRLGTFADVPSLGQIYGGGTIPTLSGAATTLDITGWTTSLQPNDVLLATLTSVSSNVNPPTLGALTCISLSLHCLKLKWPAGTTNLTDSSLNGLTDSSGNIVTLRN